MTTGLLVGGITFIGYSIPVIAIHLNHFLKNRSDVFKYNNLSREVIFDHEGVQISFFNEDIESNIVFKSRPIAEGRTPIFAWDYYNYALIQLKNGQVLKISSLLVYELDKVLKFENTEVKKTFYAWMS